MDIESTDDRLSRLSRASLRINESLEFDTVLQGVLDSARSQERGQSAGTVLVVDDDPMILRSVRDVLSSAGFRPVVTGDPEEALALMEEHSPRLALLSASSSRSLLWCLLGRARLSFQRQTMLR